MTRPTTLPEPWRSLAERLGGAGLLYEAIRAATGCSIRSAKRICAGTGHLTYSEWCAVNDLLCAN